MKIWVFNENVGVSKYNLASPMKFRGVSNAKIGGLEVKLRVSNDNLGSLSKILDLQRKSGSLQRKSEAPMKSLGLQRKYDVPIEKIGISN